MIVISISFALASLWTAIAQPLNSIQHAALMDVYTGLGCNDTTCPRFALSSNCTEPMIYLRCSNGNVTRLDLNKIQLTGTISSSIGLLTALTHLRLLSNQLVGTITSHIGQLTALNILCVGVGDLSALTFAIRYLSDSRLTGTIATQFGYLTALNLLALSNNQLTGQIPTQFGLLTALTSFYLFNNQLTGSIPPLNLNLTDCDLQRTNDSNCLDCAIALPPACQSKCFPRTCPPTPMPSTTTQQPSSSTTTSIERTSVESSTTATPSNESSSSTTTIDVGSTTVVVAMPATQTRDNNSALIGGIVGGIVALLLVVGVIAFFVMRSRKAKANQQSGGHSLQSSPPVAGQPSNGIYDRVTLPLKTPTPNEYDDVSDPLRL